MPDRAFIPGPLAQAQPRVYKSFRSRQLKGIALAIAGAGVALGLFGARDAAGYMTAFLAALPGFAYGYYEPQGKPVEYWVSVWFRYHLRPHTFTPAGPHPRWHPLIDRFRTLIRAGIRAFRMAALKKEEQREQE